MGKPFLKNALLVVVSCAVGFVLLEFGYRIHLERKNPSMFEASVDGRPRSLWFAHRSLWEYDQERGYNYVRNSTIWTGTLVNGVLTGTAPAHTNERGGLDSIIGDYDRAELKILLVGDSFSAVAQQGRSWPNFLQLYLEETTGRKVHVVNYARDGQGIAQMLDIAAIEAPRWRPHVVVLAFITDDLTRKRIWRTVQEVDGLQRVFTSSVPGDTVDFRFAVDTAVICPEIPSEDWFVKVPAPSASDDQYVHLIYKRWRIARRETEDLASILTVKHSFILDRVIHGNAFYRYYFASSNADRRLPRFTWNDYAKDPRTLQSVRRLKSLNIPIAPLHLATRSEIRRNVEYLSTKDASQEAKLRASMENVLGAKIIETLPNLKFAVADVEKLAISPDDDHPSTSGMKVYARAAAHGLSRAGFLPGPFAQDYVAPTPSVVID